MKPPLEISNSTTDLSATLHREPFAQFRPLNVCSWFLALLFSGLATTALAAQAQQDVEAKNYFGETALIRASQHDDIGTVNALVRAGANVNARDNSGMTALLKATNVEVLRALIQAGADVNARDKAYGWTPLIWSANSGRAAVSEALIESGADVDAADRHRRSALVHAAYLGHTEIVEALIKARANVNVKTEDGISVLSLAAWGCHADIVRELMKAGATVGPVEWGRNSLHNLKIFLSTLDTKVLQLQLIFAVTNSLANIEPG